MKKIRKTLCFIGSFALLFCVATINASAYNTFHDHKLVYGVGDWNAGTPRYYWYDTADPSVNAQAGNINQTVSNWVHTGSILATKIYLVHDTYKPDSQCDFYGTNEPNNYANGYTNFYMGSSTVTVDPDAQNWSWNRIYINWPFYNQKTTDALKQGVLGHELGHAMGLAHSTDPNVIMCTDAGGRRVTTPQLDDLQGINHLY